MRNSQYAEDVVSTKGIFCEILLCPGQGVDGLVTSGITSLSRSGKGLLLLDLCSVLLLSVCRREYPILSCVTILPFFYSFLLLSKEGILLFVLVGSLYFERWRREG